MPETAPTRQDRAEGLYGGAPKRCYGKLSRFGGSSNYKLVELPLYY